MNKIILILMRINAETVSRFSYGRKYRREGFFMKDSFLPKTDTIRHVRNKIHFWRKRIHRQAF
jgi:hypothetical protein